MSLLTVRIEYLFVTSVEDKSEESVFDSFRTSYQNFTKYLRGQSSIRQSLGAIFLSILTDVFAGLLLGKLEETLLLLPGLIVLIPGAMSMRGNIFGALGSRLSTAFHTGRLDKFSIKSKYIQNNIYSSITLTIFTSIALAFIARALLLLFGIKSAGVLHLLLISFIGGLISGLVLLAVTISIAFISHRKRWDPDNVTSPLITAFGDLFTIPSLALAASFILGIGTFYIMILSVVVVAIAVINLVLVFVAESSHDALVLREGSYKVIVLQSIIFMLFAGTLSAMSGLFLESNLSILISVPIILTLIPAFLEEGGNLGSILSSRLSTQLNDSRLNLKLNEELKKEAINSYILAVIIFPVVSILVYFLGSYIGIGGIAFSKLIYTALIAGLLLTTIVIAISILVSFIAFRHKINPDNVTIPLITGTADILGVFTLLSVMQIFGVL